MPNTLNLLLVDPDPRAREGFIQYVRSHKLPYRLYEADCLSRARELFDEQAIDVVALENDLGDGQALDLLHSEHSTPMVVVTDKGGEQAAVQLMKAGAMDYLIKDPEGEYLAQLADAVGKTRGYLEQRSLRRTLNHALMCINDAVFVTDMRERIIFVNAAFSSIYGYEKGDILGRHVSILFNGDGIQYSPDFDSRLGWSGELFQVRRDGRKFPASMSRSVVLDEFDHEVAVVGVIRDITTRRQAEDQVKASLKEKEVLLREIHHRVKNNLQIISSLLNLQTGYIQDSQVTDALRDSQNRVKSMALIHERLYQSKLLTKIDFKEYLVNLVRHIQSSFRGMEISVSVDCQDLYLDVDTAITCGLIVNELVSNAFHHAFTPGDAGAVRVSFTSAEDSRLTLEVRDDGRGLPDDISLDNPSSLGLQLVGMLAHQIKGEVQLFPCEDNRGTCIRLSFPL